MRELTASPPARSHGSRVGREAVISRVETVREDVLVSGALIWSCDRTPEGSRWMSMQRAASSCAVPVESPLVRDRSRVPALRGTWCFRAQRITPIVAPGHDASQVPSLPNARWTPVARNAPKATPPTYDERNSLGPKSNRLPAVVASDRLATRATTHCDRDVNGLACRTESGAQGREQAKLRGESVGCFRARPRQEFPTEITGERNRTQCW